MVVAFLNPDGTLIDFLKHGAKALVNNLQEVVLDRSKLAKTLLELEKFSLIKWDRQAKSILIHRLVQIMIRDEMSEGERTTLCNTVIDICDESFPKKLNNDTRLQCRVYFGQVLMPLLIIKYVQSLKLADIMAPLLELSANAEQF